MAYSFYQDLETKNCYAVHRPSRVAIGPTSDRRNAHCTVVDILPVLYKALVPCSRETAQHHHPRLIEYIAEDERIYQEDLGEPVDNRPDDWPAPTSGA